MTKQKVLVYTDCYIYGGSERLMIFLLTNQLLMEHYEFTLAYRKHKDYTTGLLRDFDKWNVKTRVFPLILLDNTTLFYKINCIKLPKALKLLLKIPFFLLEKTGIYFLYNILLLFIFLRKNKFDIVHINNGGYPGAKSCHHIAAACAIAGGRNIIYQVNNQAFPLRHALERRWDKWIEDKVRFFVTASSQARESLINKRGFQPDKVTQIPNTVKYEQRVMSRSEILDLAGWPEDTFLLVNVAFLTRRKGQVYLLQAIHRLIQTNQAENVRLMLVGNGEDEAALKDFIRSNGLESRIWLAGYRPNSNDFISAADVFILPSISNEDMPLALLTAMAEGKPIIATGFAGIQEAIVHELNGILVNKETKTLPDQVAAAVHNLYRNPELRRRLGENARHRFAETYSENAYGAKLDRLYKEAFFNN